MCEQRAKDITQMLRRDQIYKKRSASILVNAQTPIITRLSKRWKKSGQQENKVRILLCKAFLNTYKNAEIALEIRRFAFRAEFFNEGQRNKVTTRSLYWSCCNCYSFEL